jgi:integrase/recombinase XerD
MGAEAAFPKTAKAAGTPDVSRAKSVEGFRVTGITAYLEAGGTLENAQATAVHESPRMTKLYDRTGDEITLDEVGRITV